MVGYVELCFLLSLVQCMGCLLVTVLAESTFVEETMVRTWCSRLLIKGIWTPILGGTILSACYSALTSSPSKGWVSTPPLLVNTSHAAAAVAGNTLYVFGGSRSPHCDRRSEVAMHSLVNTPTDHSTCRFKCLTLLPKSGNFHPQPHLQILEASIVQLQLESWFL